MDESRFIVRAKITKANGTNMDNNLRAAPVNLPLHSLFCEINATLNDTPVSDPNPLYPYRSYIETILNFSEDTQKTRLLSEGWVKDTARNVAVTDLAGGNTGLRDRATRFAESDVIELVGRPQCDIFHQSQIIPPGLTLRIRLMLAANQLAIICPPPAGQHAVQEQFKVIIQDASFIIRTKKLADAAELSIRKLLLEKI